ncbi:hypothetical protein J1N35_001447 [Gossypium stocksii]|uniref:RNA helicase n=1 Tax=Gossypium stocksii TaxID=47602 RepID=A0A9D4AM83_9ROSI|nr:hypothetical protein J1N35_001447 [Gossypium stocksii]
MMYYHRLCKGRECIACAPTGYGKTLAFVSPVLMKLKHASTEGVKAVILCPTRELAVQTTRDCEKLAEENKFYIKLLTKKLIRSANLKKLRCDILRSMPLHLSSAIKKRKLGLSRFIVEHCFLYTISFSFFRVEYLVLDDRIGMVRHFLNSVLTCSNPLIICSLFSATLPDSVDELAHTIMHDTVCVIIGKNKECIKKLYEELKFDNIRVGVIHSNLSQTQRENIANDFRAGEMWVLIATNVIARSMDFKGVNCEINYDFPDPAAASVQQSREDRRSYYFLHRRGNAPFLRNIANVMAASGYEVPSWIMALRKLRWKRHRPKRESILTIPDVAKE